MATIIYKKTTVQLPSNVLRGLRQYITNHDLTSHDQSKVIVFALQEFLEADGIVIDIEKEFPAKGGIETDIEKTTMTRHIKQETSQDSPPLRPPHQKPYNIPF